MSTFGTHGWHRLELESGCMDLSRSAAPPGPAPPDLDPPSAFAPPQAGKEFQQASPSLWAWSFVSLLAAALLAWNGRYAMNPDGLSYLDMASETVRGESSNLISGYWSPLYPALISLALRIFHPSREQEFPLVHAVNWGIFASVLLCFLFFLQSWVGVRGHSVQPDRDSKYFVPLAFALFLWSTTQLIPLSLVSPDLCVCGCVFLIAGIGCGISVATSDCRGYAALGFALGLGYYAKAAMFPIGVLLLAILGIWPWKKLRPARRLLSVGTATTVFLLTCAPLIVLISQREGRPSLGETGKLNYAWYVNQLEPYWQGWTGGGEAHGTPQHPPRVLQEHPRVLEFAVPVGGTYALWFDLLTGTPEFRPDWSRRGKFGLSWQTYGDASPCRACWPPGWRWG